MSHNHHDLPEPFLQNKGGFRQLKVYKIAEILYDITYHFTDKYLDKWDRTVDQMVQAARSGKQNIAEGSAAATTSTETEIKLTNVARASLEELCLDYEDYLRVRHKKSWFPDHPRFNNMKAYLRTENFFNGYKQLIHRLDDEALANVAITLCKQANYMLLRLLERQQQDFLTQGGIREKMTRARRNYRKW